MGTKDVAFPTLCFCTCLIWIKLFITLGFQAVRINRPPEDLNDYYRAKQKKILEKESKEYFPRTERWKRIVQNDCEGIPLAIAFAWASYVAGKMSDDLYFKNYFYIIKILCIIMTIARYVHTYAYANKIGHFRTLTHITFSITQLGFCVLLATQGYVSM